MSPEQLHSCITKEPDRRKIFHLLFCCAEILAEKSGDLGDQILTLQDLVVDLSARRCDYSRRLEAIKEIALDRLEDEDLRQVMLEAGEILFQEVE